MNGFVHYFVSTILLLTIFLQTFSSIRQSPCDVAVELAAVCIPRVSYYLFSAVRSDSKIQNSPYLLSLLEKYMLEPPWARPSESIAYAAQFITRCRVPVRIVKAEITSCEFHYRQFLLSLAQYHLIDGQFIKPIVQRLQLQCEAETICCSTHAKIHFPLATIRTSQSESRFQPMRIRMFRYLHFDRGL